METEELSFLRKSVLLVLFIPSVQRDGKTRVDQDYWVDSALDVLGGVFGGATAYPKAKGIWRDEERAGHLVRDLIETYSPLATPEEEKRYKELKENPTSREWLVHERSMTWGF